MSSDDVLLAFADACRGSTCVIERREYDWVVDFRRGQIVLATWWRLVGNSRIAFGSEDDRHQFGLPERVDGEALSNDLLKGRRISAVEIDRVTADLRLHFDGEVRLDVFNRSMGYEGWQAHFEGETALIVGVEAGVL